MCVTASHLSYRDPFIPLTRSREKGQKSQGSGGIGILVWVFLAATVSEFHYLLVLQLPMMAMMFIAAHETDGVTRWLVRGALVGFAAAGLLTLAFSELQQIGLLCWTLIGLWGVFLMAMVRQTQMSNLEWPVWRIR